MWQECKRKKKESRWSKVWDVIWNKFLISHPSEVPRCWWALKGQLESNWLLGSLPVQVKPRNWRVWIQHILATLLISWGRSGDVFRIHFRCGYCKGNIHRKCGPRNKGCADFSSSVIVERPYGVVVSVVTVQMLSTPLLSYAQLPSFSSASLLDLISSSVFSPMNRSHWSIWNTKTTIF